jgi:hypothetical protein
MRSLILLFVAGAAAAEPRWGLTFKSADGCIGPAELGEAIEKRLGRATFGAKPDVRIEGWLRADGRHGWRARLTRVTADGTVEGSREVTASGASCRAIDEALVLVGAVMIDPAAALGQPAAPVEPKLEPPPPPSSAPPPPSLAPPTLPPREEWPGYLIIDSGVFMQDGRWLSRGTFYRVVGRPDLDDAYTRRLVGRTLAYVLGSFGLTAGMGLCGAQAFVDRSTQWPLIAGATSAGVSILAIIIAAIAPAVPTSPREDHELVDGYNAKLEPPRLPVTAMR